MRPKDKTLAQKLDTNLHSFEQKERPLPGIQAPENREAFIEQVVESIHRVKYISVIRERKLSNLRADPSSNLFDPLKAAVLHQRQGQADEAFWLVFLFVNFGKHKTDGWRLVRDIYGSLGDARSWDWARTSSNPNEFRQWLAAHKATLRGDGIRRRFGNHRKFETLDANSSNGTGAIIESYVNWVSPPRTHSLLINHAQNQVGGEPRKTFDYLYRSMNAVIRFGRLAKFDYLTMVGKLGLAPIEPGSTYMQGATGPFPGACLLFGGSKMAALTRTDLDSWLVQLEAGLKISFGMQVLEDALCNWQKSPGKFKPFRG